MSDLRRPMASLSDEELGAELRALAGWLASPSPVASVAGTPDPARLARLRIEAAPGRTDRAWWPLGSSRRSPAFRRSLVLAIVALAVVAAVAGAIGFGVPGIRIIFTGATPSPQATASLPTASATATSSSTPTPSPTEPGPPGSDLDLGFLTTPAEAPSLAGFPLALPASSSVGAPNAIWFTQGRITLVWNARPGLPETESAGIGLLITEFRGSMDEEFFEKMLGPGATLTPVMVGGEAGWWIDGTPHQLVYLDPNGEVVSDSRRTVGDTLIWTRGDMTFRMETTLERGAAIALAETIP